MEGHILKSVSMLVSWHRLLTLHIAVGTKQQSLPVVGTTQPTTLIGGMDQAQRGSVSKKMVILLIWVTRVQLIQHKTWQATESKLQVTQCIMTCLYRSHCTVKVRALQYTVPSEQWSVVQCRAVLGSIVQCSAVGRKYCNNENMGSCCEKRLQSLWH